MCYEKSNPLKPLGQAKCPKVLTIETGQAAGSYPRDRYRDVGLCKIVALEKQRDIVRLGQCIGRAIAEIQPGGMATLAETEKRHPRDARESRVVGDDFDV
jgi:hypothetical protein